MVCECSRIEDKSTPTNSTTSNLLLKQLKEEEIYNHPVVQELLKMIPESKYNGTFDLTFPIIKKFVDGDRHIIAGYASVTVIDQQNELIPIPVLKEAWDQFKKNKDFYFGSLMHSNIPVIKVLDEYKDKDGQLWKSGVDDNGLFIVAEVRDDIQKGTQTWELIEKGKLTGYSIGGESLSSSKVCQEHNKCYTRVDKMELHEIAVVDRPANAPSVFKIIKRDNSVDNLEKEFKPKGKELHIPRKMLNGIDTIKIDVIPNQVVDIITQNVSDGIAMENKGIEQLNKILAIPFHKLDKVYNEISKKVVQRGNQWCVIHCAGSDAGKAIKCFPTKKEADAMHGAIMANKNKVAGVPNPKPLRERLMNHLRITEDKAQKLIDILGEEEAEKLLPERGTGLGINKQDGRPSKIQWDACVSRARGTGSIKDPEAFCGDLYYNKRTQFESFSKGENIENPVEIISKETKEKLDRIENLLNT